MPARTSAKPNTQTRKPAPVAALFHAAEPPPARTVNGVDVRKTSDILSPLSEVHGKEIAFTTLQRLHLADGTTAVGCAGPDCDWTGPDIGAGRKHRRDVHGDNIGGGGMKTRKTPAPPAVPAEIAGMSVPELLEAATQAQRLGALLKALTDKQAEMKSELLVLRSRVASLTRKAEERDEFRDKAAAAEQTLAKFAAVMDKLGFVKKEDQHE